MDPKQTSVPSKEEKEEGKVSTFTPKAKAVVKPTKPLLSLTHTDVIELKGEKRVKDPLLLSVTDGVITHSYVAHRPLGVTTLESDSYVLTNVNDMAHLLSRVENSLEQGKDEDLERDKIRNEYLVSLQLLKREGKGELDYPTVIGGKTRAKHFEEAQASLKAKRRDLIAEWQKDHNKGGKGNKKVPTFPLEVSTFLSKEAKEAEEALKVAYTTDGAKAYVAAKLTTSKAMTTVGDDDRPQLAVRKADGSLATKPFDILDGAKKLFASISDGKLNLGKPPALASGPKVEVKTTPAKEIPDPLIKALQDQVTLLQKEKESLVAKVGTLSQASPHQEVSFKTFLLVEKEIGRRNLKVSFSKDGACTVEDIVKDWEKNPDFDKIRDAFNANLKIRSKPI